MLQETERYLIKIMISPFDESATAGREVYCFFNKETGVCENEFRSLFHGLFWVKQQEHALTDLESGAIDRQLSAHENLQPQLPQMPRPPMPV